MPRVRILRPCKSAMQSGQAKTKHWVMEFEPHDKLFLDELMGWVGSCDMKQEVHLKFTTLDEAIEFAKKHHLLYTVCQPNEAKFRPKSYADNFRAAGPISL